MAGEAEVPALVAGPPSVLLVPIGEMAQKPLLAKLSHELSFIWDSYVIPHEIQARLSQLGFWDANVFANLEDSKPEVRKFFKEQVGIKQEGNEHYTSYIAKLLDSWETAVTRGTRKKAEEAEQRVGDLPVRMTAQEHNELIRGYDDAHEDELEEREIPAAFVIEAQKAQLQNGALIAQRLSAVASREESTDEDVDLTPRLRADGSLKITLGKR